MSFIVKDIGTKPSGILHSLYEMHLQIYPSMVKDTSTKQVDIALYGIGKVAVSSRNPPVLVSLIVLIIIAHL